MLRAKDFMLLFTLCLVVTASTAQSVLGTGDWYKLSVDKDGVYKIPYSFLKNAGLNPDKIDPRNIRLFGNEGGMLPQVSTATRPVDLIENAIFISGQADGVFNREDFILFYGEGPDKVFYNEKRDIFQYENNLYSDKNFYFLTVSEAKGKRIEAAEDLGPGFPQISSFDDYVVHELDNVNELSSGREWYGEKFGLTKEVTMTFNLKGIVADSEIKIVSDVVGQSYTNASFQLFFNNTLIGEQKILPIASSRYAVKGIHTRDTLVINSLSVGVDNRESQDIKYQFQPGTGFSQGYLDYWLISCKRKLALYDKQTIVSSDESRNNTASEFVVTSVPSDVMIWNITDQANPRKQSIRLNADQAQFSVQTTLIQKFVVFNSDIPAPQFVAKIENQNLHGLNTPNLVIVTHPLFRDEAQRLAEHRKNYNGWSVLVVTVEEIYNEFSSGRQDVTAIRDFTKSLYDKNPSGLKALLLFGKCSYDYKDRKQNNTNFVPTYESRNSLHPLQTFGSDDYFGFLEDGEGEWRESPAQNHTLDIGVGRLPVKSVEEARNVVDKLIAYDTDQKSFAYWRKKISFVADDGNGDDSYTSLHQYQADQLAQYIEVNRPEFDTKRIFMGTYQKVTKPNGESVPDMAKDVLQAFNTGSLIVNYTGHGSERVWADEVILSTQIITELDNKLFPFLVTATCEFGRHDDPFQTSGAETSVILKDAGAIGALTSTRPVNATTNFNLNMDFYEALFQRESSKFKSIGEVFQQTKNASMSGVSNRNFSLLCDPSLTLVLPPENIAITDIKTTNGSDTLKALSTISIKGEIQDTNGVKLEIFNGVLEATLFDKENTFTTSGRNNPPFTYKQWFNALFRGKASVKKGEFEFQFILPKNIAYRFAPGKFSLYAADQSRHTDATGVKTDLIIGGTETINTYDLTGPEINAYLGDSTFVNGGITSPNTILVARLKDDSGINISSYGIGNGLTATIDDEETIYNLNDYYSADMDNFKRGWIHFPLYDLSPGSYTITVKAWDVFNNPSQQTIDFTVTENDDIVIEDFGAYPNPFTENTTLFFTHNMAGDDLQTMLTLYDLSGNVIGSHEALISSGLYMVNLLQLASKGTGKETFLKAGVYIAQLSVRSLSSGSQSQKVTKLVVLR